MRRYFIECCWGMAWTKQPFTLSNIKARVRRWEREWQEIRPKHEVAAKLENKDSTTQEIES